MPTWYESPSYIFNAEIDKIRKRLYAVDTGLIATDSVSRQMSNEMKAFAIVWLAAATEQCTKNLITRLIRELNIRTLQVAAIKPGLLGLLLDANIASVRELADYEKAWSARCSLFEESIADSVATFNEHVTPLDKKTIRPKHFEIIWKVFGLPNDPMPSPVHRMALEYLANGRNDVAHGLVDPSTFGRGNTVSDLLRKVELVDDIVENLVLCADEYLQSAKYIR